MHNLFPPRPFFGPFVRRVTVVWMFLRLASVAGAAAVLTLWPDVGAISSESTVMPIGGPVVSGSVAVVAAFVVLVEWARHGELVFLANLTRSIPALAAGAVCVCLTLEALVRLTVG